MFVVQINIMAKGINIEIINYLERFDKIERLNRVGLIELDHDTPEDFFSEEYRSLSSSEFKRLYNKKIVGLNTNEAYKLVTGKDYESMPVHFIIRIKNLCVLIINITTTKIITKSVRSGLIVAFICWIAWFIWSKYYID